MARPKFHVQHFVACPAAVVVQAAPDNPYTLEDVRYHFDVPNDQEWPVRLDDLWLYVRFFNGRGTKFFAIDVTWLDPPVGEVDVCTFDPVAIAFPAEPVHSRVVRVGAVRYPGPGRYRFRIRRSGWRRALADEYINLRRLFDDTQIPTAG